MVQQKLRLMTAEDLFALPDDDHCYELVDGELLRMSPPGGEHGGLAMDFGSALWVHVQEHHLGRVFAAETGFVLRRDPDTVRAPDVAFIHQDRLPDGRLPIGYLPFAPDLAVEIVSPSDRAEEIQAKVHDYLSAGTQLVLVAYSRTRSVVIHRPSGESRVLGIDDTFDAGDVVPGFRYSIAALFGP